MVSFVHMTEQIPPLEISNEELEVNTNKEVTLDHQEQYEIPKLKIDDKTKEEIANLEAELKFRESPVNNQIKEAVAKKDTGGEKEKFEAQVVDIRKNQGSAWRKLKTAMQFTLAGLIGATSTNALKAESGNLNDSTKNNIENIKKNSEDSSTSNKNTATIKVYPGGKTKEGAITPTGFNNSFINNEYNVEEGDVAKVAEKFGFRTTSVKDFQDDMFGYLEKNFPEDMKKLVKKYGMPAAGTMRDEILGVRVAFALSILKDKKTTVLENKEIDPYAGYAESGEIIYIPGGNLPMAEICYPVTQTISRTDGGMLNTAKQPALIRFRNDFGFTGEVALVTGEELSAATEGRDHFQDNQAFKNLLQKKIKLENKK